ncbi:MAG: type IV pilin, partial [Methanosarcinales archaeon]|nr:type IV pilin [Methanosarcinales archaeon]
MKKQRLFNIFWNGFKNHREHREHRGTQRKQQLSVPSASSVVNLLCHYPISQNKLKNHRKRTETFTKDCDAISEIIGELMMITIAVVAFGLLAVIVLSYKGPVDSPHADIDGWVNAGTD